MVRRPRNTLVAALPVGPVPERSADEGDAFFCTEGRHPAPQGSPSPFLEMFDMGRVFFVPQGMIGCPVCPACKRQVAAVPLDDPTRLPQSLQVVHDRLNAASHV